METLLEIKNLSTVFHQGEESLVAVDNVSFSIGEGETLAIVGESGSGKSVCAHSILRLLPYPKASHPGGEIRFQGDNLLRVSEQHMRGVRGNRIGMIFQEPLTALNPLQTVGRQIAEVIELHRGLRGDALWRQAVALLEEVQIEDAPAKAEYYPHQLSGGQRQRVMIAMAIANEPRLLIADEPTTALDVTVQNDILRLLREIQLKRGMAIMLITHDLGVVKHFADRVLVMQAGALVEQANSEDLFAAPTHPYTRDLLKAEPVGEAVETVSDAEPLLQAEQLSVRFPLSKNWFFQRQQYFTAVENASIKLPRGQTLGVVGESGSGKTTLAMALLKLIDSEGAIRFDKHPIMGYREKQMRPIRQQMQVVFQDPFGSLSPRMTVESIVAEGLRVHRNLDRADIAQRVIDVLSEVGLDPAIRHRYPHEFSGGQRQRIAIARAIIMQPSLIVLDEPTSALDRSIQVQVLDLLKELQRKRGLAYIFISHDLEVVRSISHAIVVMKQGGIVEQGSTRQVFDTPQQAYTRALIFAALNRGVIEQPRSANLAAD